MKTSTETKKMKKELTDYPEVIFTSTKVEEMKVLMQKLQDSGELDIFEERERLRKEKLDAENNDK